MRPHVSEKKAHIARSSLDYSPVCLPILPCAWPTRPQKRGPSPQRRGEPHDVFYLGRIWRVVALSREARADVAAALVARTDAMALIALDVEIAHFMDRLKQAQNGLIFPLPSILRNDAREFPATNSSAAKGMTPGKASGLAQQRRKRRHGASRGRAVPVWRCYTEFDSKGDCHERQGESCADEAHQQGRLSGKVGSGRPRRCAALPLAGNRFARQGQAPPRVRNERRCGGVGNQ